MGIETIRAIALKILLLSAAVAGLAGATYSQTRLEVYKSLDTQLDSSTPATFLFEAAEGEVVEFVAKHSSTSLCATVISPKGKQIFFIVSPTLFTGTLPIPFRATESGIHRLILTAERPGKTLGHLNLTFVSKRPYNPSDEESLKAFKLISEAQEIIQYLYNPSVDRSRRVIAKTNLESAIEICKTINDYRCSGISGLELGEMALVEFGDFALSESSLRTSMTSYVKLQDLAGQSLSKGRLAVVMSLAKGRNPEAMPMFDSALEQSIIINDQYLEARILTFKARILRDWGDGSKGFELVRRAMSLAGEGDREGRLRALIYAHSIAQLLGDRSALKLFDELSGLSDLIANKFHPVFLPRILNQRAAQASRKKDFKRFAFYLDRSVEVAESLGRNRTLAIYLWAAGSDYLDLKHPQKARPYLERAKSLYEEIAPREAQAVYASLGRYYLMTDNLLKSRDFFQKSVDLNDSNQDKHAAIVALNFLSGVQLKLGDLDAAFSSAEKAYNYTLLVRGNYYTSVALNGFDLSFLRESSEGMISVLFRLFEKSQDVKYLDRALEIQELAISRSLINNVRSSGFDITTAVDKKTLERISALQEQISETQVHIQTNRKQNPEFEKRLLGYLVAYDEALDDLRKKNPNSLLFSELMHLTADQIRDLLDENTVLVQYSIKEVESHAWVISKSKSHFYKLTAGATINTLAKSFTSEISDYSKTANSSRSQSGQKLSDAILRPLLDDISGYKRVVIIPDGELSATQFGALPIPKASKPTYLAEEFELGVLPSVSTLVALRTIRNQRSHHDPSKLFAVFADPVFDLSDNRFKAQQTPANGNTNPSIASIIAGSAVKSLTRLPFTSVEARSITELNPAGSKIFSGLDAKRETIVSGGVSDYRIIHFATHGFLNNGNPELSSLALSMYDSNGKAQNGFLRAIDIYSLRLNADLVVLGGCQTAGVAKMKGDGLAGLTRGFMYAGVPTVVASFWKVDDSATAYLMRYFYEGLLVKGMTPTAALRDAQLRFIKSPRWSSPKYWAAFTVQGEYDVTFK